MKVIHSLFFLIAIHGFVSTVYSQTFYQGIVADSSSLEVISGVHVKVKNSVQGTVTNRNGRFSIAASSFDTLVFSFIGYKTLEVPLIFEETTLLIRLRENINLLKEIIITASRLTGSEVTRSVRVLPRVMSGAEGVFSPIDYFSRWQKEKRKLLKMIEESDRTITYLQVVSDQLIREELIETFELTENQYYDLLARFNQQSGAVQYATDPDVIYTALKSFLQKSALK
jgi:hypothetical protein